MKPADQNGKRLTDFMCQPGLRQMSTILFARMDSKDISNKEKDDEDEDDDDEDDDDDND